MGCSATLVGWIQSPGYPYGYSPNSTFIWKLCAAPGHLLTLSFLHLDLEDSQECENDVVNVFAGNILLTKLCGRMSAQHLLSVNPSLRSHAGGCLSLSFQADFSNPERHAGFTAFYKAQDVDECRDGDPPCSHFCNNYIGGYTCSCKPGYYLSEDQHTCSANCTEMLFGEGVLSPPGSPGPYWENSFCSYTLVVQEGHQLVLSFHGEFDVESRDGYCVDSLTVCSSASHAARLLSHFYSAHAVNPNPNPNLTLLRTCVRLLLTPCSRHYTLLLPVYQILWDSGTLGPFCGQKAPAEISTAAQRVQVLFHTDQGGTNTGFTLSYRAEPMRCPGTVIANSTVVPQKSQYTPGDTVSVQCVTGHSLNRTQQAFVSTCQKSGKWSPIHYCKLIDCGVPRPLQNGGVRFVSGSNNEYRSVIQYYCNEPFYTFRGAPYVNFTCSSDRKWRASDDDAVIPPCYAVCGRSTTALSSRGRVHGGKIAPAGSFPWQVFLYSGGRGGAAVVGDRWLMTAAHTLESVKYDKGNFEAYVGHTKIHELMKFQSLAIASLHVHPGYKNNDMRTDFDNDIALIKLNSSITFNENVMPVCIPQQAAKLNTIGWVSGFGLTEKWIPSNSLRYISLPVVEQDMCHTWIEKERAARENLGPLTANMFCAGLPEGKKDTCSGDAGSAFVMKEGDVFWVAGIVSWGVDCGKPGTYGIYTRVTQYANWIRKTMEEN
ncbi:complement C1s subcomponent-like [Brachyhypopomus gauderio]|uniref:complement C1s subcomponent-like n=1 Tax=Brachyhypopomus gauderio TaxID=698409 RepID=UPI004042E1BD